MNRKIIILLFLIVIIVGCTTEKHNSSSIEGLWYSCEFNGYNEIYIDTDSILVFIDGSNPHKYKSVFHSNKLHFLIDTDTVFSCKINITSDSSFILTYKDSTTNNFYKINQVDKTKPNMNKASYNNYKNRKLNSGCLSEW